MLKKWINLILFLVVFSPGVVRAAVIVDIDHETGNLSQYTSTVTNGGNLSVSSSARMAGTDSGMNALISDTTSIYGTKSGLNNTSNKIRLRFYLDPNSITLSDNTVTGIMGIRNSAFDYLIALRFGYYSSNYQIDVNLLDDSGSSHRSALVNIADSPHYIEFYATRATTNISSDGALQWWIDGVEQTSVTGINNYVRWAQVNDLRVGAGVLSAIPSGMSGTMYLDEIVANDDGGVIGPVVAGNFPASGTYKLDGYTFGGGGQMVGSSNYNANAVIGEPVGGNLFGGSYDLGAGLVFTNQSHVPQTPTLDNPDSYYDKLHFVLNNVSQSGVTFPAETKFAVAISKDNFVSTQYVKSDNTVGTSLDPSDYQTYATWGGDSGGLIIGLDVGVSYSIKVRSIQTNFNESGWSSVANSSTVDSGLSFAINVGTGYTQAPPPYQIDMGDLFNGSVITSSKRVWVDIDTNSSNGGNVYVSGQHGGLYSNLSGYTITSMSTDLGTTSVGFGIQGVGVTQTSGGPLSLVSPYDGSGNVVGQVGTVLNQIFTSSVPIHGGRGSFVIKAKSANDTPEGSDYSEVLTVIGVANY